MINAPVLGIFGSRNRPDHFPHLTIKNTFIDGTAKCRRPAQSRIIPGIVDADGIMTATGMQDTSTLLRTQHYRPGGHRYLHRSRGASVGNGTYTLTSPATFTGELFIVSPTKFITIMTTAGDTNPVLTIFGDQADSFGVN